jgi:hypothetical protein
MLMLSFEAEDCLIAMPQLVVCHPRDEQLVTMHRHHLPPIDVVEREMPRYRGRNEVSGSLVITPHEVDASDVAIDARNSSLYYSVYLKGERFVDDIRKAPVKHGLICWEEAH